MTPDEQLAEEVAKYIDDPLGFVMFAYPWDSDPALQLVKLKEPYRSRFKCEWGPEEWACEMFDYIGQQVREHGFNGTCAVEPLRVAVVSGHGISKSATVAMLIDWIMSTRPHCKGVVTAATLPQLETKTWAELAKWTKRCITGHWFEVRSGRNSMSMLKKDAEESWRVDAQTCKEENSESFAGLHAASSTPFYIFDESSGVPDVVHDVAEGGLTDGEPMFFAFGNPTQNTGWFRECFRTRRHRWKTWQIDSRSVQITNKAYLQQLIDDYGIDSDRVKIRVLGRFPSSSTRQFIGDDVVMAARSREAACAVWEPLIMGVDVARFGSDDSVIVVRKGRDARTWKPLFFSGIDTMELAAKVQSLFLALRADGLFVDGGGVGGGVVDRLRQLRLPVIEVQFGGKADRALPGYQQDVYADKRSEMWGNMREWLKGGAIPDDDRCLELIGPEYDLIQREGREAIKLESKDSMRSRGLDSPDWADALAMTFAYAVEINGLAGGSHRHNSRAVTDYDPFAPSFDVQTGPNSVQSDYSPFS